LRQGVRLERGQLDRLAGYAVTRVLSDFSLGSGRKTRSVAEQIKRLKAKEAGEAQDLPGDGAAGADSSQGDGKRPTVGQGTMTLAQRLSQSLKDPLRAPGFLGTVSRGDIEIECHQQCKVILLKNRKGIIDADNLANLVELFQASDTNWYDQFTVFKGGEDNFCMGIDLRSLAQWGRAMPGKPAQQMELLENLYQLAFLIAKSPKTRIACIDGHSFGAGAPLALCHLDHAKKPAGDGKFASNFCITSTRTVFSIQAAQFLGMFPGCGASYFLPRLKGHIGMYLALTGVRLNGADCLYAGIASHFMPPDRMKNCLKELGELEDSELRDYKAILDAYATSPTSTKAFKTFDVRDPPSYLQRYSAVGYTDPTHLERNQEAIDRCFGQSSVDEILEALKQEDSAWSKPVLQAINAMSPTSLYTTFELLRRGSSSSTLEESMRSEWRLAKRMWEQKDCFEGVRAFEVQQDGKPQWGPKPTKEEISAMFRQANAAELKNLELNQNHIVKGHKKFGKGEPRV